MNPNIEFHNESELSPNAATLWQKAQEVAHSHNYEFAIKLSRGVLQDHQGFLPARELLRRCELTQGLGDAKKGGLSKGKFQSLLKKNINQLFELIEDGLEKNPQSTELANQLHEASMSNGFLKTAIFALETIREIDPSQTELLKNLASYYQSIGELQEASSVYSEIAAQDPSDVTSSQLAKDLSAQATMQQGNMANRGGSNTGMKNEAEYLERESANRLAMTQEQMNARATSLLEVYAQDNQNLQVSKDLANIYSQLEDWAQAESFYHWAFHLSQNDTSLEKLYIEARSKRLENQVEAYEAELATAEEADKAPLKEQLDALIVEKNQIELADLQGLVEKNPTDLILRLKLAQILFNLNHFDEAMPHLQRAENNPNIKMKALLLKGLIFEAKGMLDMAAAQLKTANEGLFSMDDTKKDVLYRLGQIQEKSGLANEALASFKQIYEIDYSYRDVAQKVESSYSS